jgi:chromosome segregation ATPase
LKDYDRRLQQENKLVNKVFGPRGSDIRGYGEAVAKRTASAVYALLNRQYGGKVGDLRSYMMTLEDDRNRSNARYDELMGRVVGVLGDEYKELRTDSATFMKELTAVLGEDLKESKIDQGALAERLADIDGLRSRIEALDKEKEQRQEECESQLAELTNDHKEEVRNLQSQTEAVVKEKEQLQERHESQITEFKSDHKEEVRSLKSQTEAVVKEKEQLQKRYESQIAESKSDRKEEVRGLKSQTDAVTKEKEQLQASYESQIAELDTRLAGLEVDKAALASDLERSRKDHGQLRTAMTNLAGAVPQEDMGKKLGGELYGLILTDSKVPDAVIKGVGQFIDFEKYLGSAVDRGASEVCKRIGETLDATAGVS